MAHTRISSTARADGPGSSKNTGGGLFWATGYTLLVLLTGTNLPTPLYHGYQQRFGFSTLTVTLIFAVYMAVLIPSLLIAGPLSDAIGRRRVLAPAVVLAVLGSLAFALAQNIGWLFVARVLQGIALGAASGPLTAALNELEPRGDRRRASLVSTIASVGGLGTGPVLAGLLAQYFPAPHVTPFVLEIVLLIPAAITIALLPRGTVTSRWRPRRPGVPAGMGELFATSGAAGFLAFAVVGLSLTLIPTYVATLSGSRNLLLGGAAVALVLACSAVAQVAGFGRSARTLQLSGLPLVAVGLVLLAVAGSVSSLPLLLVAIVAAGTGHGLVFLGGLTAVNHAAPAGRHAEVASTFLVVLYLGTSIPAVGVGFLATVSGLLRAVQDFAIVVAVLCLIVLAATVRRRPVTEIGDGTGQLSR
ncbi:MFS transporter [Nocardia sp. alder85J]|uniref:MFS transporter n=1 Tax=Nocardia sp. alder85J TaxID=2862949 RepID=UPI001CD7CEF6|nr:MFS transporter [Nocardia sp. alder85J]MCX4094358.1 MFS transporter [Nocardia sp. alder85J]